MARFYKDRTNIKGMAPGSLVLIGSQKMENSEIHLMHYTTDSLEEMPLESLTEALPFIKKPGVTWINIYGIHEMKLIESIREIFEIPPLLMENLMNTDVRPKYEIGKDYEAIIMKMLHMPPETAETIAEQFSIILNENVIITLQEKRGDVFNPVRSRIRDSMGKIRSRGCDYLAYALIDVIVDHYSILIGELGEKVEQLEDRIFISNDTNLNQEIYLYKTELNFLRKAIRPAKELLLLITTSESNPFRKKNLHFWRDLQNLVNHANEALELYNNLISDQLNISNANNDKRMNQVMKILTVFSTIFIPLTFIAGIYGMNFEHIPELKYPFAYPIFWGVSIIIAITMLTYFKRKKWF